MTGEIKLLMVHQPETLRSSSLPSKTDEETFDGDWLSKGLLFLASDGSRGIMRLGSQLKIVRLEHSNRAIHFAFIRTVYPLEPVVAFPRQPNPLILDP